MKILKTKQFFQKNPIIIPFGFVLLLLLLLNIGLPTYLNYNKLHSDGKHYDIMIKDPVRLEIEKGINKNEFSQYLYFENNSYYKNLNTSIGKLLHYIDTTHVSANSYNSDSVLRFEVAELLPFTHDRDSTYSWNLLDLYKKYDNFFLDIYLYYNFFRFLLYHEITYFEYIDFFSTSILNRIKINNESHYLLNSICYAEFLKLLCIDEYNLEVEISKTKGKLNKVFKKVCGNDIDTYFELLLKKNNRIYPEKQIKHDILDSLFTIKDSLNILQNSEIEFLITISDSIEEKSFMHRFFLNERVKATFADSIQNRILEIDKMLTDVDKKINYQYSVCNDISFDYHFYSRLNIDTILLYNNIYKNAFTAKNFNTDEDVYNILKFENLIWELFIKLNSNQLNKDFLSSHDIGLQITNNFFKNNLLFRNDLFRHFKRKNLNVFTYKSQNKEYIYLLNYNLPGISVNTIYNSRKVNTGNFFNFKTDTVCTESGEYLFEFHEKYNFRQSVNYIPLIIIAFIILFFLINDKYLKIYLKVSYTLISVMLLWYSLSFVFNSNFIINFSNVSFFDKTLGNQIRLFFFSEISSCFESIFIQLQMWIIFFLYLCLNLIFWIIFSRKLQWSLTIVFTCAYAIILYSFSNNLDNYDLAMLGFNALFFAVPFIIIIGPYEIKYQENKKRTMQLETAINVERSIAHILKPTYESLNNRANNLVKSLTDKCGYESVITTAKELSIVGKSLNLRDKFSIKIDIADTIRNIDKKTYNNPVQLKKLLQYMLIRDYFVSKTSTHYDVIDKHYDLLSNILQDISILYQINNNNIDSLFTELYKEYVILDIDDSLYINIPPDSTNENKEQLIFYRLFSNISRNFIQHRAYQKQQNGHIYIWKWEALTSNELKHLIISEDMKKGQDYLFKIKVNPTFQNKTVKKLCYSDINNIHHNVPVFIPSKDINRGSKELKEFFKSFNAIYCSYMEEKFLYTEETIEMIAGRRDGSKKITTSKHETKLFIQTISFFDDLLIFNK